MSGGGFIGQAWIEDAGGGGGLYCLGWTRHNRGQVLVTSADLRWSCRGQCSHGRGRVGTETGPVTLPPPRPPPPAHPTGAQTAQLSGPKLCHELMCTVVI